MIHCLRERGEEQTDVCQWPSCNYVGLMPGLAHDGCPHGEYGILLVHDGCTGRRELRHAAYAGIAMHVESNDLISTKGLCASWVDGYTGETKGREDAACVRCAVLERGVAVCGADAQELERWMGTCEQNSEDVLHEL